jgi:hypothetical protein
MIIFYGQNNKLRKHHRLSFSKFNKTIQYVLVSQKKRLSLGGKTISFLKLQYQFNYHLKPHYLYIPS